MESNDKKYQEVIARLTSPEKYARIRGILLAEIEELKGIVEHLDRIVDKKNETFSKLN